MLNYIRCTFFTKKNAKYKQKLHVCVCGVGKMNVNTVENAKRQQSRKKCIIHSFTTRNTEKENNVIRQMFIHIRTFDVRLTTTPNFSLSSHIFVPFICFFPLVFCSIGRTVDGFVHLSFGKQ